MENICVGWTTLDTAERAEALACGLVRDGLAACAQVEGPVISFYRWEGKLENSREWRVMVKFPEGKGERLMDWLREHHPYATPQWLAVRAAQALPEYAAWVAGAGG